ncbi:c-type cytochrome [Alcanivorax sp. JB21]|uniref:c-type cytochrome n=1 Tax=Alcanivorax limicola TaxID=2874102 RepID=UPI001CBB5BB2|nr:c-type cytochrome [Alcanivorax limicola]MBZ2188762.1 c-type cytochrome [Alcanivorax limicola]
MKWKTAVIAAVSVLALSSAASAATVEERYNSSCVFCHASGAAGAPKTGDEAAWAPRLEKGMETLVKHTREGLNAMPPRGMCGDCSDDEYRALIEYMTK